MLASCNRFGWLWTFKESFPEILTPLASITPGVSNLHWAGSGLWGSSQAGCARQVVSAVVAGPVAACPGRSSTSSSGSRASGHRVSGTGSTAFACPYCCQELCPVGPWTLQQVLPSISHVPQIPWPITTSLAGLMQCLWKLELAYRL